jgi:hypothetical protein
LTDGKETDKRTKFLFPEIGMLTLNYPKKQSVAFSNYLFSLYEEAKETSEEEILFDLSRSELLTPFGIQTWD